MNSGLSSLSEEEVGATETVAGIHYFGVSKKYKDKEYSVCVENLSFY